MISVLFKDGTKAEYPTSSVFTEDEGQVFIFEGDETDLKEIAVLDKSDVAEVLDDSKVPA